MAKKTPKPQPVHKTTITWEDGEMEGWECEVRTNAPLSVFTDLSTGEFARIAPALAKIVLSWNFPDVNGNPLPKPSLETISELPLSIVTELSNKFVEKLTTLGPNS